MKILHLINYTGGGGTESYIYSLAQKLHNKKCQFFIAYSEVGDSYNKFEELGIEMIHLPMHSPCDFKAARKLKAICRENEIDVVHTHFLRENYISILSKVLGNKVKLINTRHMLDISSRPVKFTNNIMTKFNDKIIAVSRAVEELLKEELGGEDKIELIYTGIDPKSWIVEKPSFRKEYNVGENTLLITSTARFSQEKGHEFLLNSIYTMKNQMIRDGKSFDFKFVMVGGGNLFDETIDYAKELGIFDDIIFTGYRSDIANILNDSDIFVCMSEKEAFGISIMEALATKLPVITTDSGGTTEIITDKKTGIIVDFNDVKSLANAIYSLIEDKSLREKYSKEGFNLIKNKFSLDKTASKTFKLYRK